MAKADRQARKAARRARKADKRAARQDKRSFRADTRLTRKSSRRDKRAERQAQRQDARSGRIDARKSVRMAKVQAKQDSGYWSPEAVEARQGTIGSLIETGGGILGGILGGGAGEMGGLSEMDSFGALSDGGFTDAAEMTYPTESYSLDEESGGEVVDLYDGYDDEAGPNWLLIGGIGAAAAGAIYWFRMR